VRSVKLYERAMRTADNILQFKGERSDLGGLDFAR